MVKYTRAAFVAAAVIASGCAEIGPDYWSVKTADQAIAIANEVCGDATKDYPGPWRVRLKDRVWEASRFNPATEKGLTVWIYATDGDPTLGCIVD